MHRTLTVAAFVVALVGCNNSTSPKTDEQGTHPTGDAITSLALIGRPHGVSVAQSGIFYVSQIDAGSLTRGAVSAASESFSGTVALGSSTPAHVAIDRAGTRAYSANQFGTSVSVVNAQANTLITTITLSEQAFNVLVSPDGSRVYVSTEAGHLLVIDASTRQILASVVVGNAANGIAIHPASGRLFVSSIFGGTISAIDLATNQVTRTYTVSGMPQRIAVAPQGNELYIASEAVGLEILDLSTGSRTTVSGVSAGAVGLALSPDAVQIYVTNPPAGIVQIVDRVQRSVVKTLTGMGRPRNVAFTSRGETALVTDETGRVVFVR